MDKLAQSSFWTRLMAIGAEPVPTTAHKPRAQHAWYQSLPAKGLRPVSQRRPSDRRCAPTFQSKKLVTALGMMPISYSKETALTRA
jgi:hypothetical protein